MNADDEVTSMLLSKLPYRVELGAKTDHVLTSAEKDTIESLPDVLADTQHEIINAWEENREE